MQYNNNSKLDGNNYQADDQYINQGANNVQYDDDAANAAMAERDNYDKEMGDDGYLNMDFVDMNEVSIMPVSCVFILTFLAWPTGCFIVVGTAKKNSWENQTMYLLRMRTRAHMCVRTLAYLLRLHISHMLHLQCL